MNAIEAIAYLRAITSGDPRAQEALDVIEMLGKTADVLGELHEELAKARDLYAAERQTRAEADRAYQERTDLLAAYTSAIHNAGMLIKTRDNGEVYITLPPMSCEFCGGDHSARDCGNK